MSNTIALLTDFGWEDNYVGIMKGVILKINPRAQVVDLCHAICPQDILQGALALKSAYRFFPSKTIFLAVVDPGVGSRRKALIVKTRDHFFVGPDNGLLSPVLEEERGAEIRAITNDRYFLKPLSQTFHGRDIFAPVAAWLSRGTAPSRFGPQQRTFVHCHWPQPGVDRKKGRIGIRGEIIAIDHFGNLITNIEPKHLNTLRGGGFRIKIKNKVINRLARSYAETPKGDFLAIVGSKGYLEIAINQGSAGKILKVVKGDSIEVEKFPLTLKR